MNTTYLCPLCSHPATDARTLRLHLNNTITHTHADILSITRPLSLLRPTPLLTCLQCHTKDCLYLGKQGLTLHQHRSHRDDGATPVANRSNSTLIHNVFASITYHDAWLETLQWLTSPQCQLLPPPFRYSLYNKLSSQTKRAVQDCYLSLLRILKLTAGRDSSLDTASEYTSAPILRLIFLFEAVILAPPTTHEPRQYSKLIPERIQSLHHGLFHSLYTAVYALLITPQRHTNMDPSAINRQVEAAVRDGDYSAGVQRLDPKPSIQNPVPYSTIPICLLSNKCISHL